MLCVVLGLMGSMAAIAIMAVDELNQKIPQRKDIPFCWD
jgi:hypothetical protein